MASQLNGCPHFLCFVLNIFYLKLIVPVDCVLSVWGKIMIPMYRLRLRGLYELYGPHCPLSPERPLNLITHSPSGSDNDLVPIRRQAIIWTNYGPCFLTHASFGLNKLTFNYGEFSWGDINTYIHVISFFKNATSQIFKIRSQIKTKASSSHKANIMAADLRQQV